ncbi:MAG TPA: hypothetical protein VK785_05495 [Opitutaceae bacterium]|nr:hypothetical protein [Opitutaceae bacterium]
MPQSVDLLGTRVYRVISRILLGTVCVLVVGFYAWTARREVRQMYNISDPADAYYNQLVQGFRSGQLNLKRDVPLGLTKLADPYDPVTNVPYRKGGRLDDASYYKGKLYLYFGVTPVVVLFWPYVVLTGHYLFHKQAVAIFCSVGFLASVALLCALRQRYFPEVGIAVLAACALALGLANCVPVMLQHSDVWEVPISCAYAMVMLALAGIWRALHDPARRCWWLAAASLAYGLAVGARPNVLFGAVILLVPVFHTWLTAPESDDRRRLAAGLMLVSAVIPISLSGFGLMAYNYMRFDNPFEFGQHYQMSSFKESELQHMFSPTYLWFNFRIYFLQPLHWSNQFPFVKGIKLPSAPAGQLGVYDDTFGILPDIPLVWLALTAPLAWQKRTLGECSILRLFIAAMAIFFGISALTIGFYAGVSVRYQVDFVPVLLLLAVCGILGLERTFAAKLKWRSLVHCAWVAVLFFSVTVNLLMCCKLLYRETISGLSSPDHPSRTKETAICFLEVQRINSNHSMASSYFSAAVARVCCLAEARIIMRKSCNLTPLFGAIDDFWWARKNKTRSGHVANLNARVDELAISCRRLRQNFVPDSPGRTTWSKYPMLTP